jgi:3-phenylpropionate/trans-cinnamate dioxygenase ferredoxin reductase subunit
MGFMGCEVAASLRQRGLDVVAVDSGSAPLGKVLGPEVGRVLEAIHRDHGVRIVFNDRLAAFEGTGRVEAVRTESGQVLPCDLVFTGLGATPVLDVVAGGPVEVGNGILVDQFCATNVGGIFAAGDVANHFHPRYGRRVRVEHWNNALRQGRVAALNMLDRKTPYDEVHWFWSDQFGHNLQYAGYHETWDDLVVRGSLEDRQFVAFYLKEGRVQAVVAMDQGPELRRATSLVGSTVDREELLNEAVDPAMLS